MIARGGLKAAREVGLYIAPTRMMINGSCEKF